MSKQHPGRELLRRAREQRRWSLRDLEEELGERGVKASNSFLSQVEKGDREPDRLELVIAFEELFEIPAESWKNFAALTRWLELRQRDVA